MYTCTWHTPGASGVLLWSLLHSFVNNNHYVQPVQCCIELPYRCRVYAYFVIEELGCNSQSYFRKWTSPYYVLDKHSMYPYVYSCMYILAMVIHSRSGFDPVVLFQSSSVSDVLSKISHTIHTAGVRPLHA